MQATSAPLPRLSIPSLQRLEESPLPYKLGYKTPPLIRPVSLIRPFPRISFHQNRFIRPGLISNLLRSVCSLPLTAGEIKEVMDRGVAASWWWSSERNVRVRGSFVTQLQSNTLPRCAPSFRMLGAL